MIIDRIPCAGSIMMNKQLQLCEETRKPVLSLIAVHFAEVLVLLECNLEFLSFKVYI